MLIKFGDNRPNSLGSTECDIHPDVRTSGRPTDIFSRCDIRNQEKKLHLVASLVQNRKLSRSQDFPILLYNRKVKILATMSPGSWAYFGCLPPGFINFAAPSTKAGGVFY